MQVGQQFLTADGDLVTLSATSSEEHPEGISVYNLTVEEDHTFFVSATSGDEMVWVHNEVGTAPPGTQWYPAGPSVAPYKVPLPGPTSPTSGGGMSPGMKGNLLIWGGMLASDTAYNNLPWYRDMVNTVRGWEDEYINRPFDRYIGRPIDNFVNGLVQPAPSPQPDAGGVGQKPPAPPIAPTSQPSGSGGISALRRAMIDAGIVFLDGEQAAHIVPENMGSRSPVVQDSINRARSVLQRAKIAIDSAANGFGALPGHLGTHTDAYLRCPAPR